MKRISDKDTGQKIKANVSVPFRATRLPTMFLRRLYLGTYLHFVVQVEPPVALNEAAYRMKSENRRNGLQVCAGEASMRGRQKALCKHMPLRCTPLHLLLPLCPKHSINLLIGGAIGEHRHRLIRDPYGSNESRVFNSIVSRSAEVRMLHQFLEMQQCCEVWHIVSRIVPSSHALGDCVRNM
jgi:hypothetical protein